MVEQGYTTRQLIREVSGTPRLRMVPHIGYVSLFPLMGRIIPPVRFGNMEPFVCLFSNSGKA